MKNSIRLKEGSEESVNLPYKEIKILVSEVFERIPKYSIVYRSKETEALTKSRITIKQYPNASKTSRFEIELKSSVMSFLPSFSRVRLEEHAYRKATNAKRE